MKFNALIKHVMVVIAVLMMTCLVQAKNPPPKIPDGVTLTSIAVTPKSLTIPNYTRLELKAIGTYSNHTTRDITNEVEWEGIKNTDDVKFWSNLDKEIESLVFISVSPGNLVMTATQGNVSGSTPITIKDTTLTSILITPENPSITNGSTIQFTATGIYSDQTSRDITDQVRWTSSTPNLTPHDKHASGLFIGTALLGGSSVITAQTEWAPAGELSASTTVTVK